MDEIASNLRDYLKSRNKRLKEFLVEPEVSSLMRSSLNSRSKTEKLRQLLYSGRFPILSEANTRIRGYIKKLELPEGLTIDWDRTLENKRVDFHLSLRNRKQWHGMLKMLESDTLEKALKKIMDEL
jgi:hypothetical protein